MSPCPAARCLSPQARFYTDLASVPGHYLRALRRAGADIYPVDMTKYGNQSMFWRFWAAADTAVERFISRDVLLHVDAHMCTMHA